MTPRSAAERAEPEPELMIQINYTTAHAICQDTVATLMEDLNREDWVEALEHAARIAEIAEAVESAKA